MLARLLAAPPDETVLQLAAGFDADDTALGQALGALGKVAARFSVQAAAEEYFELFIGIGRGELVPYASYYRTGFLHDRPLARLRGDMLRLGIARAENVREPEDHIAALCEMMAGLIEGDFGAPLDLPAQRAFFDAHLAPWAERFFGDLEAARAAVLYAPVGTIGRVFMGIEETAFGMEA
ncbi:MAG TPA: molecular chaperone TorD family protein [Geminicoccaceae bacterium]|nr:molecular chaperone TorD family protein [Geminicoccaceae bacterium]